MTRILLALLTIAALCAVGCAKKYPMVFGSGSFSAACRIVDPPEPCTKELMEKQHLEDLVVRCAQLNTELPPECYQNHGDGSNSITCTASFNDPTFVPYCIDREGKKVESK